MKQNKVDRTIANLMMKTGGEFREVQQALEKAKVVASERNLLGADHARFAFRVAYNALIDQTRKKARQQKLEISIYNENPVTGEPYAESISDRDQELRQINQDRLERLESLLLESGERVAELARLCYEVSDALWMKVKRVDDKPSVSDIQKLLRETWHKLYPHANSRDYYANCEKLKRCLTMVSKG